MSVNCFSKYNWRVRNGLLEFTTTHYMATLCSVSIKNPISPISCVGTHQRADLVYSRTGEPTARGKIFLARGIHYSDFLIFFTRPASPYYAKDEFIYTYLTAYRLYLNYCCCQILLQVKHFYTNWERCKVLTCFYL